MRLITLGQRAEERRKSSKKREGEEGVRASLAGWAEVVPESGDVSKELGPLSSPSTHSFPVSEVRMAID